jgi:uncharacterized membrane protein YjgN (DUF898 family)
MGFIVVILGIIIGIFLVSLYHKMFHVIYLNGLKGVIHEYVIASIIGCVIVMLAFYLLIWLVPIAIIIFLIARSAAKKKNASANNQNNNNANSNNQNNSNQNNKL